MTKVKNALVKPFFWALMLFPAGLLLCGAGKYIPGFADVYFNYVYKPLALIFGSITGWFTFSLMETGICLLFCLSIYWLIRIVLKIKEGKNAVLKYALGVLKFLAGTAAVIFFLFAVFAGVNYYRAPFAEKIGLSTEKYTKEELYSLCAELLSDAEKYGATLMRNQDGSTVYDGPNAVMAKEAQHEFSLFANNNCGALQMGGAGTFGRPKPIIHSEVMAYLQISGVFSPYTMEANICSAGPDFLRGATMMHEQAHLRGFMNEAEANFIAYLAGVHSGDHYFKYSSTCLALLHSMNALYREDYESWYELRIQYPSYLSADMAAQNAYIAAHETPVAEVSDKVNDTYLKLNDQEDGVKSYGKMVDLLLAYKKAADAQISADNP